MGAGASNSSPQTSERTKSSRSSSRTSFTDAGTHFHKKGLSFGRCYGRGAFGKVVAVKRKAKKPEMWYAAKILDKKLGAKVQADLKNIITEVNILVKVQSKFIANLHGGFCDEDSLYLILDLLVAGSLENQLHAMPDQTEENARFYISNILAALEHLHMNRIIHRDLKPGNILMCDKGYLKLVDFGASYIGTEKNKSCNYRSGTIPYMAPEIFCKSPRHNYTVDIYALGVILFEILYKNVPYERGLKQAAPFIEKARRDMESEIPAGYAVKFGKLPSTNDIPSEECQNLVHRMMDIQPWSRLGAESGVKEVFEHSFFEDYDVQSIMEQTMVAPYIPNIKDSAVNNQHEDCLDIFGGHEEETSPLTEEQALIYSKLADTLSKFNDSKSNAVIPA